MIPACPICDAARARRLFMRRSPYSAARGRRYQAWRCGACEHLWCEGDATDALLRDIYQGNFHASSQQSAADSVAPVAVNARARAARLVEQGMSGRLLDIGAGNGFFVRSAMEAGFAAEGIELSPAAAEAARAMGADVKAGDFLTGAVAGPYDVITMWDVLSGMTDPHAVLARVAQLLKPGGYFVATVADGAAPVARLLGRFWPLMIPPVNLHFFSRTSLRYALERHDLSPTGWRHDAKCVALRFVGQKLARVLGLHALDSAAARLIPVRLTLSLNLGDIATVAARRGKAP